MGIILDSCHYYIHSPSLYTRDVIYIYIYIYTTSEKPANDQSYGVLDGYGITILYK